MRSKEEVQEWLDKHVINDVRVEAVDNFLVRIGYDDMGFSVGPSGDITFIDLINFCFIPSDPKEEIKAIIDKIDSSIAVLCQEYSKLKKIIRKL